MTLSPDGETLYAVNSGSNSVAVIPLEGRKAYRVSGLIPTAYEPHDITLSADGSWMYIISGKSVTGPNPGHLASSTASITSITVSRWQCCRSRCVESVESISVPAGASLTGQRTGTVAGAISIN